MTILHILNIFTLLMTKLLNTSIFLGIFISSFLFLFVALPIMLYEALEPALYFYIIISPYPLWKFIKISAHNYKEIWKDEVGIVLNYSLKHS